MIESELQRLGALNCLPLIQHITRNFIGFPSDGEQCDPAYQLLMHLQKMRSPITAREIYKIISTLDAFSWRGYIISPDKTPVYWNPLETPWVSFYPGRTKTITQTEWEYPPPDIIFHYCECFETALTP